MRRLTDEEAQPFFDRAGQQSLKIEDVNTGEITRVPYFPDYAEEVEIDGKAIVKLHYKLADRPGQTQEEYEAARAI